MGAPDVCPHGVTLDALPAPRSVQPDPVPCDACPYLLAVQHLDDKQRIADAQCQAILWSPCKRRRAWTTNPILLLYTRCGGDRTRIPNDRQPGTGNRQPDS